MAARLFAGVAVTALLGVEAQVKFISWGDYGTDSKTQKANAAGINAYAAKNDINFIVNLGDNMYDGPFTVWDPRWKTEFMDMYTAQVPFYQCMGNHDYKGSVEAQLQFKNDTRWILPATNYTVPIPEADLTIIYVDSPRACPSYMSAPYGDCNENCMTQLAKVGCINATSLTCWLEHMRWLNDTLASITTKWKIVAGHHPIDQEHMPYMVPSLVAHGVQAYLAGHVHNLQHTTDAANGIEYYISGAGAYGNIYTNGVRIPEEHPAGIVLGTTHHRDAPVTCGRGENDPLCATRFLSDDSGFLTIDINGDVATTNFISANGTVLYTHSFKA